MKVLVNWIQYCKANGLEPERERRLDYAKDFVEMDLEPVEVKRLIGECVDLKTIDEKEVL